MGALLLALFWSGEAMAAVCTSQSAGTWNTAARWLCGGVARVPLATDTVVVAHNITLNLNTTIAGLTVNNGVSLIDDNNNRILTIAGDLVVNGTIASGGGRISMDITGPASIISGTGTYTDTRIYTSGANQSIAAGATLNFTGASRFYTGEMAGGANATGSVLTINGTINSTVTTATTTFLRLYANSTVVSSTGIINASVSAVSYNNSTATLTNNGSVNVNRITQNAASNAWSQGINSSLTVSAVSTVGTLNASANGNTVTYNGTSTAIAPGAAGYWNLAGTIYPGACPHGFTVSGSDPCPAGGPTSVTLSPSNCVNVAGIGTLAWGTPAFAVSSNNAFATVSLNDFQVSNYLRCTNYGFAIPATATILGITVNVERKSSNNGSNRDAAMRLVRDVAGAPTIQATDRSTLTNYTTADVIEPHGGAADLWGGTWTPADINLANFGAAVASQKPGAAGGARTVTIDHMPITVTYTTNVFHHASINAPATAMSLTEIPAVIAPHTSTHAAITAAGTINLSTSTGTGDWTIGTGTGMLTPGAVNSGLATYTFGAGENSATLGFTSQNGGSVTLNVADSGGADMLLSTPAGEKANTITFSAAAFVFTSSACTHNVAFGTAGQCALVAWSPRIAGQPLANVYITSVNAAGVPTRLHPTLVRTRGIQFALSCHDPVANAGVQATFSAAAAALPLCQANGVTPTIWTAAVTLSFPGGSPSVGPYSFNYDDVGKVELWMRNSVATMELGPSGAFVVKPAGFVLSNIIRTSDSFANPGALNAGDKAFVKAGDAFTVTVTVVNSTSAATPNYGKEITAESVKLTSALVGALGLTNNPAISGTFGAFANGVATGAAFSWGEVGIITLTPSVLDADYLGAGDTTGTTTGNVGRFYAHHFAATPAAPPIENRADLCNGGVLISDGVTPCVPAFTYMGEQLDMNFTLTAQSLTNTTTQNYAGAFAKLDPAAFSNPLGLGAVDSAAPTYLTSRLDTLPASGSFLTGNAAVVLPFSITRPVVPDGPYAALDIGIAPVDSDGAAMGVFDLDTDATVGNDHALIGTTEVRYGRMKLSNAHGSELLPLTINVTAQYWNGMNYVTNILDNESSFSAAFGGADVTDSNYQKNLNSGDTNIITPPASVVFVNGIASYRLSAPGAINNGSVDMAASVPGYLPSNTARATFGVYKGANEFIYLRENY